MTYTILRYAGFGREATFGGEAAVVFHVDHAGTSLETPTNPEIVVPTALGRTDLVKRPGYYYASGNVDYDFDLNTIGMLMKCALNGYTFTTGTPNTHEFYGNNELVLESLTVRLGKDFWEHVFLGSVINSLALNTADSLARCTVGLVSQKDLKDTLVDFDTLELTASYPVAFHEVTAKIGTSDVSAITTRANVNIANNINAAGARTLGSRFPVKFRAGARAVTGGLTLYFEDMDNMELFWGDTTGPDESGVGATMTSLTVTYTISATMDMVVLIPNAYIEAAPSSPRGKEPLTQDLTFHALLKQGQALKDLSTVNTDILVTLRNAEATLA